MILTQDAVYRLLSHPDEFVSGQAFCWFADSFTTRTDVLPVLLDRILDRSRKYRPLHILLGELPADAESLSRMLRLLDEGAEEQLQSQLNRAVPCCAPGVLLTCQEKLSTTRNLNRQTLEYCQQKIPLHHMSGKELWSELLRYCCELADSDVDPDYVDDVARALGTSPDIPVNEVLDVLADPYWEGRWVEIAVVLALGYNRSTEAIPTLLKKIRQPFDEHLHTAVERALMHTGFPILTDSFRKFWRSGSDDFRASLVNILRASPVQKSEAIILLALEQEKDITTRTLLCSALCGLYSDRAIEVGLQEIARGYDRELLRLEDDLLIVADSLGVNLPHAECWRQERIDREESYRKASYRTSDFGYMTSERSSDLEFDLPVPTTKIDRNSPCPCGSSKKYKKCCGRG